MEKINFLWNLLIELRKELVESQKIRAQVIGFKITFVSASIGLLASNSDKIDSLLFTIPAFAAIFFDFLINSYSFSIKRIGFYIREYLEPELKQNYTFTKEFVLWQEFLRNPKTRQILSSIGNLGITFLAEGVGILALFVPFRGIMSISLLVLIILFMVFNFYSYLLPGSFHQKGTNL